MHSTTGKSALPAIAIGPLRVVRRSHTVYSAAPGEDAAVELRRFEAARQRAIQAQYTLRDKAQGEVGSEMASLFDIHAMLLKDAGLIESVRKLIVDGQHSAEYAVSLTGQQNAAMMASMDDPYMAARSVDIEDVTQALLDELTGEEPDVSLDSIPVILMADDLSPSETVRLDKKLLMGFVTRGGSTFSHTAILARSMNLPALVQCPDICEEWDGHMAILDGHSSTLYIDPSPQMIEIYRTRQAEDANRRAMLEPLRGLANTTRDGVSIQIDANIAVPDDLTDALANDAAGVGLFRSEFIYLNSTHYPTEEEQYQIYKQALLELSPRRMVVRTCDIGADKMPDYMVLPKEDNPALGHRGIRLCLADLKIFKTQLRALLRAACHGRLAVMFPMVSTLKELEQCKALLAQCRKELTEEGVPTGNIEVGSMIETPAAVLCADELAAACDFFSIGTNDLLQYTFAIDRQNEAFGDYIDPHHPVLLREIQMTVEAAHRRGIPVCICGELGADPTMTEWFLRNGVDALSVHPTAVLKLRELVRKLDLGTGGTRSR